MPSAPSYRGEACQHLDLDLVGLGFGQYDFDVSNAPCGSYNNWIGNHFSTLY
jgi:hypothetical protein